MGELYLFIIYLFISVIGYVWADQVFYFCGLEAVATCSAQVFVGPLAHTHVSEKAKN